MALPPEPIDRFFSVIPAGGVGSRLWPLSRAAAPKFLHDLSDSGHSLLRDTWLRLAPLSGEARIMVVTGDAHAGAVRQQLPELTDANLVLEAEPRDSSAAIGLAAAILARREPDVIIGSFAADHVIRGAGAFRQAVAQAVAAADAGYIATLGITPTRAATGFGYIHSGEGVDVPGAGSVLAVESFVEKPDHETAVRYLRSGDYLWNAGMFIAKAEVLLDQLAMSEPELHAGILEIAAAWDTEARAETCARVWPTLNKIAVDFSVAEPAAASGRLVVVPGHFTWDDVGDYASIARLASGGQSGELVSLGDETNVYGQASSGIVFSEGKRVISLLGVKDIVIVDTPDALLVTTMENAQGVKSAVDALREAGRTDVL